MAGEHTREMSSKGQSFLMQTTSTTKPTTSNKGQQQEKKKKKKVSPTPPIKSEIDNIYDDDGIFLSFSVFNPSFQCYSSE